MLNTEEKISKLSAKIEELEIEIADAKRKGKSDGYIIAIRNELTELRKKENIILERTVEVSKTGNYIVYMIRYISNILLVSLFYYYYRIIRRLYLLSNLCCRM